MHKLTLDPTQPTTIITDPATNQPTTPPVADEALQQTVAKPYGAPPTTPSPTMISKPVIIGASIAVLIAGAATGFGAYQLSANQSSSPEQVETTAQVPGSSVTNGDVFGSQNAEDFVDTAEGVLESGGINGEGSHKLLREGGESQTVYLTSSVTDLEKLVGMKVKVWGETFKAQQAGWLMDVGRVQVLETRP